VIYIISYPEPTLVNYNGFRDDFYPAAFVLKINHHPYDYTLFMKEFYFILLAKERVNAEIECLEKTW
jgi:hypothetical protein